MNLYQAGYFRLGMQGVNAGWQLVSASDGMSQNAKEGFQGIASTLIGMKNANVPVLDFGVFKYDRFVYLLHINYQANGEDARGVSYVHCYCFNQKDYLELSMNPEKLFGIDEGCFPNEYDSTIRAYPVVNEITYSPLSVEAIRAKYNISDEHYKELVLSAISVTEGLTPALCLKKELPKEEYRDFYRDMLYLIDMGLPYQLRSKITAFSYSGVNDALIYVTDQINSTNYVDFDNNDYHLEYDRVKSFEFVSLYDSVPAIDKMGTTWDSLSSWISETMEGSPKENGCPQIEAAYYAALKGGTGIASDKALDLLNAFLAYEPVDCDKTHAYLASLLKLINESGVIITDKKLYKNLQTRFDKSENEEYKVQCNAMVTARLLNEQDQKSAYTVLYDLYKAHPEQYAAVYAFVMNKKPELGIMFRLKKLLPEELVSFEAIKAHIQEVENDNTLGQALTEQDYVVTLSCLKKVATESLQSARNFTDMQTTERAMKELLKKLSDKGEKVNSNILPATNQMYATLWTSFQTSWFEPSPDAVRAYMNCELDYVSTLADEPAGREAARTVLQLISLASDRFDRNTLKTLEGIVFANNTRVAPAKVQEMQLLVLNKFFETGQVNLLQHDFAFDTLLTISYDAATRRFNAPYLGTLLERYSKGKAFDNENINKFVNYSGLLTSQTLKDSLMNSLDEAITREEQYKNTGMSASILKGLKKYLAALSGKELKSEEDMEYANGFLTAMYRGIIGIVVMGAFALMVQNIKLSFGVEDDKKTLFVVITLAVIGLIYLGILVMKMIMSQGIKYIAEDAGLLSTGNTVIYFLVMAFMIIVLALVLIMEALRPFAVWLLIGYLFISVILMVISDFYVEVE